MTNPVTPPAAPTVPEFPALGDPSFNAKSYTFGTAMPGVSTGIGALATNAFTNATAANESAATAVSSANSAASAAEVAMGATNFKGLWDDLTGALAKPATVKHDGRFWLLLNNLANVTTSEPGVSADWTSLDTGTAVTQVITGDTTAIVGVTYLIAAATLNLTLPATGLVKGDFIGIRLVTTPTTTQLITFGAVKFMGQTVTGGYAYLDIKGFGIDMKYEDATYGWA